jgi:hypothetical protein
VQKEVFVELVSVQSPSDPALARPTVLVAPADAIPALRQKPFLQESVVLSHTDVAFALARIREAVPAIIAVERDFADTPDGQSLLGAIRGDSNLSTCQVQTVGVRRSHRYRVDELVTLDGTRARLLDISATGAHVLCASALQPTQELQVVLRMDGDVLPAVTVWVQFELPREGPQYRAGIQFASSAAGAVAEYISQMTR